MKFGMTRWKILPLKCKGLPLAPTPFSPVHKQRKFSTVLGTSSPKSPITIRPASQNNNILLGDKATINAKPQLEIFADDVKCSHGCTIGQLDENAMFYMQQRGIPKKEAKALLMYAFSNEVIESIKIPELKQRITKIIATKLGVNLGFDL